MRKIYVRLLPAALLLASFSSVGDELVDRIVAVVDDDPIFLSDIERAVRLGLTETRDDESPRDMRRRVLDEMIEQRLRLHEVERYDAGLVSIEEVDRQVAVIRERFRDEAELEAVLADLGLDEDALRHLVRRQLSVLLYIEERLRARVFVDLEDVRTYYETELAAEMTRRGAELPPLAEVREAIRIVLLERRLNEEIDAWTEELRLAADVVDHFDRVEGELPPVVRRIEDEN